ncbi:multimerin-2a [Diretmus argenteus]
MTAVGELVLILGLLVSAHCEVRARDPEVEEEEEEMGERGGGKGGGGGGGGGFGIALPPQLHDPHPQQRQNTPGHPGVTAPPPGDGGNYPARTGNWCAFVHRRMVTTAVACGPEKYTIKSQSRCPNGTPDCRLVMYKLATRPVYREKQTVITALLWRCCPGHGGENCEDTVSDSQVDSGSSALIGGSEPGSMELHTPGTFTLLTSGCFLARQRGDPDQEQNDYQDASGPYEANHPTDHTDDRHNANHPTDHPDNRHNANHPTDHTDDRHNANHPTDHPDNRHNANHSTDHTDDLHNANHPTDHPDDRHHTSHPTDLHNANHPTDHPDDRHNANHPTDHPDDHQNANQLTDHTDDRHNAKHPTDHPDNRHNANHPTDHPDDRHNANHPTDHTDDLHNANHPTDHTDDRHNANHPKPDTTHHATQYPGHAHNPHHRQQGHHLHGPDEVHAGALPYPDTPSALPLPHMMALLMSQLQPVLEGFNQTLEHLSQQVGDLALDVAQLRSSQLGKDLEGDTPAGLVLEDEVEDRFKYRLDETFEHIEEVRRQMEIHRDNMEEQLHSQHAMLHYNLTSFKTEIDMKLKRNQKMLQVSLQAMNTTLAEMKLDQEQKRVLEEEDPLSPPGTPPPSVPPPQTQEPLQLQQPQEFSALWEAIERLDNKVVNNSVEVNGLEEDVEGTLQNIEKMNRMFRTLEDRIAQTGRNSQIQFMETGLEVEAAKEVVLTRVKELAGNLSQQSQRLQEMDIDVDYLYTTLYKSSNLSEDCDCKALKADISQLGQDLANITELANENRLALDGSSEAGGGHWGEASDWQLVVGALQHGLQQVKESLAFEQSRTRTLHQNLTQLSGSVADSLAEVAGLQESDRSLRSYVDHLTNSFASLLKDAVRHSDVLELLLGEEVLEFLAWPVPDQEAHSIPALKEQIHNIQEQLGNRQGGREETPAADQPASSRDWLPGGLTRRSGGPTREHQLLHPDGRRLDYGADGGDLWSLEKSVEELGVKVRRLEEKPCPARCNNSYNNEESPSSVLEAKLQAEVMWLRRGLEEHLRVFKNVFSNAEVLAGSDATLDLDKLWNLVKNKEGKREKKGVEKKRGGKEGPVENPLLFLAGYPQSIQDDGFLVFEASLNCGHLYSNTGVFTAPVDGTYLFVLTLDLRPGPAHVGLRRKSGGGLASLHREEVTEAGAVTRLGLLLLRQGEEVRLELREGALADSPDSVFAGLLLHQAT